MQPVPPDRHGKNDSEVSDKLAELHDALLDEMDRIRDPFRSYKNLN
jgi:hypothetical protein